MFELCCVYPVLLGWVGGRVYAPKDFKKWIWDLRVAKTRAFIKVGRWMCMVLECEKGWELKGKGEK